MLLVADTANPLKTLLKFNFEGKLILIKIEYSTATNMKNLKNLNPCNRDLLKKQVIRLIATCLLCSCAPTYGLRTIQNHPLYFEENMEPGDLLKIHLKNGDKVQLELVEFDQEKLVGRTVKKSKKSPVNLMDVYYEDVKMIQHHEKLENNDVLNSHLVNVLGALVTIGATLLYFD